LLAFDLPVVPAQVIQEFLLDLFAERLTLPRHGHTGALQLLE
jgi:hypothetical protein